MAAAGVPVLPELDPASVTERDLPVLIKASAGGGGRGMRIVRDLAELPARGRVGPRPRPSAAFGDPTVFCEPYVEAGRHIEVQVLADTHGTVWSLGERECSLQRRHQKVVEETPSPMVDDALRAELSAAAVAAARAIGYVGAGTSSSSPRPTTARSGSSRPTPGCRSSTRSPSASPGWTWSPSSCASPRGSGCRARRRRRAAPRSRSGSTPRTRPPAGGRAAARCAASRYRPRTSSSACSPAPVSGSTPASSTDRSSASPTTRCWPRSIAWAPTRAEAAAPAGGGARRRAACTAWSPTATCWCAPCGTRSSSPAAPTPPSSTASGWTPSPLPWPARTSSRSPRWRPRWPARPRGAATPGCSAGCRAGGGTSRPSRSGSRSRSATTSSRSATGHARHGVVVDGRDDVVVLSATPDEVVLEVAGVEQRLAVALDGDTVDVDGDGWAVSLRALPRLPDAAAAVAEGSLVAPMPGTVARGARGRGGQGRRPASRCWCSRR